MDGKILINVAICCLLLTTLVNSQDIIVTKDAPKQIEVGEILKATIQIENKRNEKVNLTVTEQIGSAEVIDPEAIYPETPKDIIAWHAPYFEWNVIVKPNSVEILAYKIKPINVGYYTFTPTFVRTLTGETYYSNPLTTHIVSIPNGKCEPEKGENYVNSPEDCPSGSADNLCGGVNDGTCDPDCEKDADVDCLCGDSKCEGSKGESYNTCPQDCPSGSSDNYCDKINDGNCDPDCLVTEDSDCKHVSTSKTTEEGVPLWLLVIVMALVLVLVIYLLFRKWK